MARRRRLRSSIERYGGVKLKSKNGTLLLFVILPILAIGILEKYWIQISVCAVLYLTAYLYEKNSWRKTLRNSGIDDIDKLHDGRDFEKRLEAMFEDLGYRATLTPHNDYGCDIVVYNYKGMKTAVQVKLRGAGQPPVGVGAVQEVTTSMPVYKAIHGIVITNRTFSSQARILAQKNGIELWSRDILITKLAEAHNKHARAENLPAHPAVSILQSPMLIPVPNMEVAEELNPNNVEDSAFNLRK